MHPLAYNLVKKDIETIEEISSMTIEAFKPLVKKRLGVSI